MSTNNQEQNSNKKLNYWIFYGYISVPFPPPFFGVKQLPRFYCL